MEINIEQHWGIKPQKICRFRTKNPFSTSDMFVLDNSFFLKSEKNFDENKLRIMSILKSQGIPILLPKQDKIVKHAGTSWLMYDFIRNIGIDFLKDMEIAHQIGTIISDIAKIDPKKPDMQLTDEYISDSVLKIKKHFSGKERCDKRFRIVPKAFEHLDQNLFPYVQFMNKKLSHGDLHLDNLLIEDNKLRGVIDWEIAGIREELYDLAYILGCIGIADPPELAGEFAKNIITSFIRNARPSKLAKELLLEMVMATRLKWLYKWTLNPDDLEIIDMETKLISMLYDKQEGLKNLWNSWIEEAAQDDKIRWIMQNAHMVKDIDSAKQRMKDKSYLNPDIKIDDIEQYSTDLRLIAIDFGMDKDMTQMIDILNMFERLSHKFPDNMHFLVEKMLLYGNICLAFSQTRMTDAVKEVMARADEQFRRHPDIDKLVVGYSAVLRNASIAFAEDSDIHGSFRTISELIELSDVHDKTEVKEELARALSNGITTILRRDKHSHKEDKKIFWTKLKKLYKEHPDSKKILGAYKIAKLNLQKAGILKNQNKAEIG